MNLESFVNTAFAVYSSDNGWVCMRKQWINRCFDCSPSMMRVILNLSDWRSFAMDDFINGNEFSGAWLSPAKLLGKEMTKYALYLLLHRNENRSRLCKAISMYCPVSLFFFHNKNRKFFSQFSTTLSLELHSRVCWLFVLLCGFAFVCELVFVFQIEILGICLLSFHFFSLSVLVHGLFLLIRALSRLRITTKKHAIWTDECRPIYVRSDVSVFYLSKKQKPFLGLFSPVSHTKQHTTKMYCTTSHSKRSDCLWYAWFH